MPEKLAIKILQQDCATRSAHTDKLADRLFLSLQILEKHSRINDVEAVRWKLHRVRIATDELHPRIVTVSFNCIPNPLWTNIDSGRPDGRIALSDLAQNHTRPASDRENVSAGEKTMSDILLHPGLGIDLQLEAHGLARIVHDVRDGRGRHHHCDPMRLGCTTGFSPRASNLE